MAILRKTEHPNIVKYLWVGRGGSLKFSMTDIAKEYSHMLTDTDHRWVLAAYMKVLLRKIIQEKNVFLSDLVKILIPDKYVVCKSKVDSPKKFNI